MHIELTPLHNRALGTFLGLVVGDALGTTLEFAPRAAYAPLNTIVGEGPFNLPAGGWTDDTSMALAIADALYQDGQFNPHTVQRNFLEWLTTAATPTTAVALTSEARPHVRFLATKKTPPTRIKAPLRKTPPQTVESCASPPSSPSIRTIAPPARKSPSTSPVSRTHTHSASNTHSVEQTSSMMPLKANGIQI